MKKLLLTPNLNVRKEGILCTLNVNLQSEGSLLWLKRKLKSFLMNNITFYFKATTNTKEHAAITLNKLYQQASEKYVVCAYEFKRFHLRHGASPLGTSNAIDLRLCEALYSVIRGFFRYLVCSVPQPVFDSGDYERFFRFALVFFKDRFALHRAYFRVAKILTRKLAK